MNWFKTAQANLPKLDLAPLYQEEKSLESQITQMQQQMQKANQRITYLTQQNSTIQDPNQQKSNNDEIQMIQKTIAGYQQTISGLTDTINKLKPYLQRLNINNQYRKAPQGTPYQGSRNVQNLLNRQLWSNPFAGWQRNNFS